MKEIKDYLKQEKKDFKKGVALLKKFGKKILPDFQKYNNFFADVKEGEEGAAPGILETKLNYILRIDSQNAAKKKSSDTKAIKSEEDLKAEAKNSEDNLKAEDPNKDPKEKK